MGFLSSLDISASALTAQRMRMDVISENIANADTTRTANGGPYRRRVTVLAEQPSSFSAALQQATGNSATGGGVVVSQIVEDQSAFEYEYDPDHPDADVNGYVAKPNVDTAKEIIDMMSATRSYEANVTALNATKSIAMKALEIGR
jgi:flagellar basal-body rod protein FlgC